MFTMSATAPINIKINKGNIIIYIDIKTLQSCLALSDYDDFKIINLKELAVDVKEELLREDGDGTTAIHLMIDAAIGAAIENGSNGVREK